MEDLNMRKNQLWLAVAVAALMLALAPGASAQLNSNQATVNLNAVLGEAVTVSAGPGTVNFALAAAGIANGSSPVSITTSWVLASSRTGVSLHAYFSSAVALTDGSGNNIPTSNVEGSVNGGGFGSFTGGAGPFGTESIQVFNVAITPVNVNSSRTDSLDLRINTTGLGLPAGTYTGVLNIQAQAI
jgi:hypothetical protein